ncbi:hypothetical protein ACQKQC_13540 [Vibrio fortis]|uniref:hypothetical protein n=1 Tax=Vibrio fortis TaxID=212667 RepID=UPI004067AE78
MKDIVFIYFERIFQTLVGLFVTYLLVNTFSSQDYGLYKYVLSFSSTFVIFCLLGFNFSNIRFIPEYLINKDFLKINYQLFFLISINLIVAILAIVSINVLIIYDVFELDGGLSDNILSSILVLNIIKYIVTESIFYAFSKRIELTKIRIFSYLILLLINIVSILIYRVDIYTYLNFYAVFCFIESAILAYFAIRLHAKSVGTFKFKKFKLNTVIEHAKNNYGFTIVNYLRDNALTILLISYVFGYDDVSYYAIALIIPNVIRTFTPSKVFSGFIVPLYVKKYHESNEIKCIFDGVGLISKFNVIYLIPSIIFSLFMYQYVITSAFGVEYYENSWNLSLFLFANIFLMSLFDLNLVALNVLKRSDLVFKINILSVSNVLIIILFNEYGQAVIGLGNLISTLLTITCFWIVTHNVFGYRLSTYILSPKLVTYSIFMLIISYYLIDFGWVVYSIVFLVVAFLMTVLIIRSDFIENEERSVIMKVLPRKIGKICE